MNRTRRALAAAMVAAGLALTACGDGGDPTAPAAPAGGGSPAAADEIVVGSANFQENVLLANIYAEALKAKGVKVTTRLNIGSREAYLPGLQDGSIDLIPEYTGVLLQYFDKTATATAPDEVYSALQKAVPANLTVLEKSAAEDKDAVVVTKETADKYKLRTIADLAPVAKDLSFGGPPEFKTRPDGIPGLTKNYGVTFKSYRSLDAGGPLTINALKNGQVDAADIFTTDPSLQVNGFVTLEDPKSNFAAQNVLPLINKAKASENVTSTLNAVSAKLDTETLKGLLSKVITDKQAPAAVATEWLKGQGLI